jgi:hypothetical protein
MRIQHANLERLDYTQNIRTGVRREHEVGHTLSFNCHSNLNQLPNRFNSGALGIPSFGFIYPSRQTILGCALGV